MNKFYLLVAASCLLGISCSEESYKQDFSTPRTNRISFSCTAEKSDGSLTIWDSDSQIGLFCEQTGTNNQKLSISAASTGSETALFYTDLEWQSGTHKFALYTPYDESNTSTVIRGTLPTTYAQTGTSADYLARYNLTYGLVESTPTEKNTPVAVMMKSMLKPVEIHIQSSNYTSGWTVEQVSIEAQADQVLAGDYTFDLATGDHEFTAGQASKVTINLPSLPMSEEGVSAYMLAASEVAATSPCTFEITLASETEGNLLLSGTHTLAAATELSVDEFDATVVDDDAIDLSKPDPAGERETANCYIASQPGVTYKFPATVMGNGYTTPAVPGYTTNDGMAPGITPTRLDPKSAQVLWQTAPDLVSNVKLRNGYVYFTLNGEAERGTLTAGNAVIAVYSEAGASGDILWSWHIWVTDADLDAHLQTWTVHADAAQYSSYRDPQLMDRNLGALTTADFSESGTNESHGLHYQWGRKDPFIGADNSSSQSRVAAPTYDSQNKELGAMTKASSFSSAAAWTHVDQKLSRSDIAKYPMAFVSGADNHFWMEETAHDLWGLPICGIETNDLGHKTIYDPCPPGYRVMNPYAMSGVTSAMAGGTLKSLTHRVLNAATYRDDQAGLQLYCDETRTTITKLPAGGLVYYEKADNFFPFDRTGTYGYYWTTTMMSSGNSFQACRMHFDWNNFVSMEKAYASYGHNVRCEKIK